MSVAIRELGLRDQLLLEELLDVCGPGWSDHLAPGASGPMAFIADPRSFAFGAYIDTEVAGWLWGAHMWRPDGQMMSYVHDVDVVAEHRRKGVATSLIEAAIGLARRNESHAMWLLTDDTNEPATALYEATGGSRLREDGHDVAFVWRF